VQLQDQFVGHRRGVEVGSAVVVEVECRLALLCNFKLYHFEFSDGEFYFAQFVVNGAIGLEVPLHQFALFFLQTFGDAFGLLPATALTNHADIFLTDHADCF
jgi:hypothetical protein